MIHGPDPYKREVERRLFQPIPNSNKVQCVVCGERGLPGARWQRPHRKGHGPCPTCGRQMTLRLDYHPRKHRLCGGPR